MQNKNKHLHQLEEDNIRGRETNLWDREFQSFSVTTMKALSGYHSSCLCWHEHLKEGL